MSRWPAIAWPGWLLCRGVREAGLAVLVAVGILLFLTVQHSALIRGLETASLDLRFRLRGVQPPEAETIVVLVDDRSLAALGRWPLSRRLFAQALWRQLIVHTVNMLGDVGEADAEFRQQRIFGRLHQTRR